MLYFANGALSRRDSPLLTVDFSLRHKNQHDSIVPQGRYYQVSSLRDCAQGELARLAKYSTSKKDLAFLFSVLFFVMVCTSLRAQTIIEDLAKNPTTSEGQIHIKADAGVNALIGRAGNGEILQKNAPTPTPPAIATTVSNAEQYEQKNSAVSQKSSVPTAADISAAIAAAKARMSAVPAVTTSNTPSNPVAATTNPDPPVPAKVVGMDISDLAEDDIVHVAGFRVQVYFGNAQNKARTEAEQRQSAVKNKFPGIGTYMTYSPPNFKVTVGDFLTREDAEVFKQLLIKALPFGRESFIVPAKIKSANF